LPVITNTTNCRVCYLSKLTYNQQTLELIEAFRTGILAVLDEEGMLPKGSDEAFVTKVTKAHTTHSNFTKSKKSTGNYEFTIK
jgi:myosin heavy subunit